MFDRKLFVGILVVDVDVDTVVVVSGASVVGSVSATFGT